MEPRTGDEWRPISAVRLSRQARRGPPQLMDQRGPDHLTPRWPLGRGLARSASRSMPRKRSAGVRRPGGRSSDPASADPVLSYMSQMGPRATASHRRSARRAVEARVAWGPAQRAKQRWCRRTRDSWVAFELFGEPGAACAGGAVQISPSRSIRRPRFADAELAEEDGRWAEQASRRRPVAGCSRGEPFAGAQYPSALSPRTLQRDCGRRPQRERLRARVRAAADPGRAAPPHRPGSLDFDGA